MRIYLIVGILCITAIVITFACLGYNGYIATGGVGAIVGICTWKTAKGQEKRKQADEIIAEGLRKAGYDDKVITDTLSKIKGGTD